MRTRYENEKTNYAIRDVTAPYICNEDIIFFLRKYRIKDVLLFPEYFRLMSHLQVKVESN